MRNEFCIECKGVFAGASRSRARLATPAADKGGARYVAARGLPRWFSAEEEVARLRTNVLGPEATCPRGFSGAWLLPSVLGGVAAWAAILGFLL